MRNRFREHRAIPDGSGTATWGFVRGIGSEVTRVQVGDRVVTRQPHQSEYITDESASIVKVPDGVHPEDAVYTHLYALSGHLLSAKRIFSPEKLWRLSG